MKLGRKFPTATEDELRKLKEVYALSQLVPKVPPTVIPAPSILPDPPASPEPPKPRKQRDLFSGGLAHVPVTKEPLKIDNPVELLLLLMPEIKPYRWQFEQLMMAAGYLTPGNFKDKTEITDTNPLKLVLSAANGSGKDMIIIAAFAVWFALTGVRNRVIITSSSFEQTKFQTEVHIRELVLRVNKKFGKLFHFTQFHYIVPELGSEIKLFATDEPGRAEGYHPYPGGKMALIMNEAKSIREDLFDALSRCTGYSHWLEISSPGVKRGHMYRSAGMGIPYPSVVQLGLFYFRKVTAYECPHIPVSHIKAMIYEKGENSPWVRSSIFAEFSDYNEPVAIPEYTWDTCRDNPPAESGSDIGIGLDLAAGGDENTIFVRKGNRLIFHFCFRQEDTTITADVIDKQLSGFKNVDYIFRADDGGVGHAIIDMLVRLGWRIRRTNNQSPSYNKREFLNLGAEMYFRVKRLCERKDIIIPGAKRPDGSYYYKDVEKLKEQLTTRRYKGEESTQGKFALESKSEARASGLHSPDRGDGFVLCFSTYKPGAIENKKENSGPKQYTIKELLELERSGRLFMNKVRPVSGRFTQIQKI